MRLLGMFAHPDDAELWAGGTLALQVSRQWDVVCYTFYQNSERRRREALAGAACLGIDTRFIDSPDYTPLPVERFLSEYDTEPIPDILLSHWQDDTHIEHVLTFNLAMTLAHYWKRHSQREVMLLMTSGYLLNGRKSLFEPDVIVDISPFAEQKDAAVRCHVSQNPEVLLRDAIAQDVLHGMKVGTPRAEGFLEFPMFGQRFAPKREDLGKLLDHRSSGTKGEG